MANATEDLKTILANGQALIICGAGVSAALTGGKAPGWQTLIKEAVEYGKDNASLSAGDVNACEGWLISGSKTADWLKAARVIREALGDHLRAFFKTKLEPLAIENNALMSIFSNIQAANNPIATTNYDDLLAKGLNAAPATWEDHVNALEIVQGKSTDVFHMHGHWKNLTSVNLSDADYDRVFAFDLAKTVRENAVLNRTIVFVGCSNDGLNDGNIGKLLDWLSSHWKGLGQRHFVLCLKKDMTGWPSAVMPISYGENHADLTGFLQSIAPPLKVNKPRLELCPNMQGRKADLHQVVNWVLADRQPIIIPGQPGMGKSALALELAYHADVQAKFGDERYFLRLDAATDAAEMMNAVALRLKMQAQGNVEYIAEAVAKTCVKPTLLILDNLETPWHNNREVVEAAIARLAAGNQLNLVLTIRGETPNLSCDAHQSDEIAALQPDDAKALFLRGTRDKLRDDPDLDELIKLLDGHPLSIILMAAQADAESAVANLLKRWADEKAKMLTKGEADHRLNNLMISVNLSFEKLSLEGKRLARLVARLPAGLAPWIAQDILGEPLAKAASLELAKARLLTKTANRLTMLAPLRAAIMELSFQEQADEDALRTKLIGIAARGNRVFEKLSAREQEELENLDSTVNWTIAEDKEAGLQDAITGLATLHRFTGRASISSIHAATEFWKAKRNSRYLASTLLALGQIALDRSNHEEARTKFEEALLLYKSVGDVQGQANCIMSLGDIALARSSLEEAKAKFEEALPLYKSVGDVGGQANCIKSLGDIALRRSNHDEARAKFEEALDLYGRIPEPYSMGHAHRRLSLFTKGTKKSHHRAEARRLWLSIDRADLVAEWLEG